MSAQEVMAQGYAPSTVWKVQRRWRRALQAGAGTAPVKGGATTPRAIVDAKAQPEVQCLQAENEELRAEVEELRQRVATAEAVRPELAHARQEIDLLGIRIRSLQDGLSECERARDHAQRELAGANNGLQEAERRLKEVTEENSQLKAYLASKNCTWEEDFLRFKHGRRYSCPFPLICTYSRRRAHGGPIFSRCSG